MQHSVPVDIEILCTSPGHNFRGHFGKDPGTNAVVQHDQITVVEGKGIAGDRYFGEKEDFKGQITFFDLAVAEEVGQALGIDFVPEKTRRNVFLRGLDLNSLIGKEFECQGIRFRGAEECSPCFWMDEAFREGAEELMKGRGGLRARILSTGILKTGSCDLTVSEDAPA